MFIVVTFECKYFLSFKTFEKVQAKFRSFLCWNKNVSPGYRVLDII
jgi:hypothetical protein